MVVGWLLARRYFCGRQSSLAVKLPAEREGGVSERECSHETTIQLEKETRESGEEGGREGGIHGSRFQPVTASFGRGRPRLSVRPSPSS